MLLLLAASALPACDGPAAADTSCAEEGDATTDDTSSQVADAIASPSHPADEVSGSAGMPEDPTRDAAMLTDGEGTDMDASGDGSADSEHCFPLYPNPLLPPCGPDTVGDEDGEPDTDCSATIGNSDVPVPREGCPCSDYPDVSWGYGGGGYLECCRGGLDALACSRDDDEAYWERYSDCCAFFDVCSPETEDPFCPRF